MLAAANHLTSPDYVVIAAYLLGTIGLGLYIGRRMKTGTDFFLAGRRLPWWAIGMSLVATDIGGTDIIGVGGAAYKTDLDRSKPNAPERSIWNEKLRTCGLKSGPRT